MKSESAIKTADKSGDTVYVHPLVILNISDHWTRVKAQSSTPQTVFGALLGKQMGRDTEIHNSFELKLLTDCSDMSIEVEVDPKIIDEEYFTAKTALYKETFSELEFIGFYVTDDCTGISQEDEVVQRQAMKVNEAPFLLKFNTLNPADYDRLQITIFESIVDPVDESKLIFHSLFHKIQSEYSEQIGLDHVERFAKSSGENGPSFSSYVSSHLAPVNALLQQINIALEYVKAVKSGELAINHQILMDIHKLCVKLTTLDEGHSASTDLKKFSTDQKLVVLLTALTNVEGSMFSLISKLNLFSSDRLGSSSSLHPFYREKKMSHFWRDFQRATGSNF